MHLKYISSFEWIDGFSTFLTDLKKNQKNQDSPWDFCVWAVHSRSELNPMWFQDSVNTILYLQSDHKDIMCVILQTKEKHIYLISGRSEEEIVKRLMDEYSSWRSEICEELQELPKEKSPKYKDNKALRIDIAGPPPRQLALIPGKIYVNTQNNEKVEFGYMGTTGYAICYEPGDSGGGMQSSFGIKPEFLIEVKA